MESASSIGQAPWFYARIKAFQAAFPTAFDCANIQTYSLNSVLEKEQPTHINLDHNGQIGLTHFENVIHYIKKKHDSGRTVHAAIACNQGNCMKSE